MSSLRSFGYVVIFAAIAGALPACKKDEPAQAKPEPSGSAARDKSKLSLRNPLAPTAKIDPQAMKEYRMDVCYYGTLTLRQARDAYLASLGKDEPSEKKIPSFGAKPTDLKPGATPAPGGTAKPAAPGGTGAPKSTAAATAKPTAAPATPPAKSGDPKAPAGMGDRDMRRPFDVALRAPHERNARACTVAAGHKDPPMPDVDPALQAFAPYAVELAKNIAAANTYYQREEYKKDNFAKGKELHKKLTEEFAKLDDLSNKLGAAIEKWRAEHPADQAKFDEAQKLAHAAFEDARAVIHGVIGKKPEAAAHKAGIEKLEKSAEALKTFGSSHQADAWPKIMNPAFDGFIKASKEAGDKIGDKGLDNDAFLSMITSFTSLVEAKQRALSRAMIAKGQTNAPAGSAAPAPGAPGHEGHGH